MHNEEISWPAEFGIKGRLTGDEFVQQWSSVGPRSTSKLARFGAVWTKFLWGFDGEGRGVFMGQENVANGQPKRSP